jgi:sugar (pentulose or hexulose) kinase
MNLFIGIDLGTTAMKGILISDTGEIISTKKTLVNYEYPQNGFVEFSSEVFYESFCSLLYNLTSSAPVGSKIVAVSISGGTGNTLLLDKNNKPLCNTISWLDNRALNNCHDLLPGLNLQAIHKTVGWPFLEIFPLAHLAWLKSNKRDIYKQAAHFLMNITYIYYRLTGKFGIDHSTATTFYLQNQEKRCWHLPFLKALGIDESQLPSLFPSGTQLGTITERAAVKTGINHDAKVVLGSFDHPAAAKGTGVIRNGQLLLSCGTSWVGFYPINDREKGLTQNMLLDPFLSPEGPWGTMFSIPGIGRNIETCINVLSGPGIQQNKYDIFNSAAKKSPVGANGIFVNILDNRDRLLFNIKKLKQSKPVSDIYRAIMECTAYEMRIKIEECQNAYIEAKGITMVGGASESRVWTQIVADVTGKQVNLLNGQIAGALGSAIMAGIGSGFFENEEHGFKKIGGKPIIVEPDKKNSTKYNRLYQEYKS